MSGLAIEGSVRADAPAGKKLRAAPGLPRPRRPASPFRHYDFSPEVIRLVVMRYVRFPLSLLNVEDLLVERDIDICHETGLRPARASDSCADWRQVAIGLTAPPTTPSTCLPLVGSELKGAEQAVLRDPSRHVVVD
jgi:hypothetical protein